MAEHDDTPSVTPSALRTVDEFDIKDVLMVLRRRLNVIMVTVAILTGGAFFLATHLTPEYTSTATIVVDAYDTSLINFEAPRQSQSTRGDTMVNTYVEELTSNFYARSAIERLDLLNRPEFSEALRDHKQSEIGNIITAHVSPFVADVGSWIETRLIAIGLASQPPPGALDGPVHGKLDVVQLQEELERTAALQVPDRALAQGQRMASEKPSRLDGGDRLTELDRLRAMVQGDDLSVATLIERSAKFVPNSFETAALGRTRVEESGSDGSDSMAPSQEGHFRAAAVATSRTAEALMVDAIEFFLDGLSVSAARESYAISVSFTFIDPLTAAQVANTLAALFVENQLESKRTATAGTLDWLAGRLDELRAQLVEADKAAGAYRAENQLLANGRGLGFNDQELAALSEALIRARAERVTLEAKLGQMRELHSSGQSLEEVPEVLLSTYIAELREREMDVLREEAQLRQEYGPQHPKLIEINAEKEKLGDRIDAEVQHVIGSVANQIATLKVREDTLHAKLEEAKIGSLENSRAEIQLRILEREAESTRKLYATFLDRFKQLTEQREILEPGSRLISEAAVPTKPSFPQVKLMTGAGFMGSLMFGLLFAFVVDRLDRGLCTGRQVENMLRVPSIGLVPKIGRAVRGLGPHVYLAKKPISPYAESIRSVQTALSFSNVDRPPQVILVTSSLPGEGKTTLALSLAAILAASGYRTVALDLDMRAPALGRRLRGKRSGDLGDYMRGQKDLDEILQEGDPLKDLHIIRTRRLAGNPTDLLASQKMADLMTELRARYRYVILDSPPVLGMSDALFAARLADASIFVVRWNKTDEEVAQRAIATLRDSGIRIAGVVLTQINIRRQRKYSRAEVAQYYGRYKKYYVH